MANKGTKRKTKSSVEAIGLRNRYWSDTADFFLGLITFAIAAVIILAMANYLFTGQADQSLLENLKPFEIFNNGHEFKNLCGSIGALLSYYLITVNFGYPAFMIPVFMILVSLKLMRAYTVNLLKWFLCLAILMVWLSVTLAKFLSPFMGEEVFNPGGKHGLFCVQTLEGVIGAPGLLAILIVTAIAFLTYLSHETIEVVRKALNPVKYVNARIRFTITNNTVDNDTPDNDEMDKTQAKEVEAQDNGDKQAATSDNQPNVIVLDNGNNGDKENTEDSVQPAASSIKTTVEQGKPGEDVDQSDSEKLVVEETTPEVTANSSNASDHPNLDTPINPWEPFVKYHFPGFDLLKKYDSKPVIDMDEIKANNSRIVEVLKSFKVDISEIHATVGPTVTLYEVTLAEGVRISRIRSLEDDIALSLSALGARITPIPGKGTVGIEVPNKKPQMVSMESVLNTKKFQTTQMALPMALGKTITNEVFMVDLAKLPHLLVAGATG